MTIDSQYNVPSEIIATWHLSNDLNDICNKISANCMVSSCLFFLSSLKSNAHALCFAVVSCKDEGTATTSTSTEIHFHQ